MHRPTPVGVLATVPALMLAQAVLPRSDGSEIRTEEERPRGRRKPAVDEKVGTDLDRVSSSLFDSSLHHVPKLTAIETRVELIAVEPDLACQLLEPNDVEDPAVVIEIPGRQGVEGEVGRGGAPPPLVSADQSPEDL